MTDILDVYFKNHYAGELRKKNATLSFHYDTTYVHTKNAMPVSAALPLCETAFTHAGVEAFFSGLLPDGNIRVLIARHVHTDEQNTFSLLKKLGGDCAGAIALYEKGKKPSDIQAGEYTELSEDEAFEIVIHLKNKPFFTDGQDFRISGAGAQNKLIACVFGDTIAIPLHGTPSTHILKPGIEGFEESVYNEFFCMKLAQRCEQTVPNICIKTIKKIPLYVIERYDRKKIGTNWERLHQEDFCQIAGVPPTEKYENDGGPNLARCFSLLTDLSIPANDKIAFLNRVIFNFLVGNGDAHAKNFAILYAETPRLAPIYDVLSTIIYTPYPQKAKMAMKLGRSSYEFSKTDRQSFEELADISGFRKDYVLKRLDTLLKKIIPEAQKLCAELNANEKTLSSIYEKIISVIVSHSKQVHLKEIQ